MITWREINNALGAVVSSTLKEIDIPAERIRGDVKKPIARRSYRIDLTSSDEYGTETYAERGVDVEIYLYPKDKERPRDELNEAAQAIKFALRTGLKVGGIVIAIDEGIEADMSDDILALMFRLEWIETAEKDGHSEMMEDLYIDGGMAVDGSEEMMGDIEIGGV